MFNLDKDYIEEIKSQIGEEEYNEYLSSLNEPLKSGFVINTKKTNFAKDLNVLFELIKYELDINNEITKNDKYIDYKKEENKSIGKTIYHHQGLIYSQEPSSYEVIKNVDLPNDFKFIDLCASPGGKSINILLKLNRGYGVLNEIDKTRCQILKSNIERMGLINTIITNNEPKDFINDFSGYFDMVIMDVPCSGEGMFKKSDGALKNWSLDYIKYINKIQKEIINIGINLLKPNGIIVYSTCTFNRIEDENNVDYMLNSDKSLKLIKQDKLYPHKFNGEGQFYAIFKRGEGIKSNINDNYTLKNSEYIKQNKLIDRYFNDNLFKSGKLIYKKNDKNEDLYYIDNDLIGDIDRFSILKTIYSGLYLGNIRDNEFIPSNELAHSIKYKEYKYLVEINIEKALKFLSGEVIDVDEEVVDLNKDFDFSVKKHIIITVNGIGLGIGRLVNKKIKNLYPKGLRNF